MKEEEEIRIVGKGLTEEEINTLLLFVTWRLKKTIVMLGVRYHG